MDDTHEGPPRRYVPVCIRYPLGFYGGPAGYEESEDTPSPIDLDASETISVVSRKCCHVAGRVPEKDKNQ